MSLVASSAALAKKEPLVEKDDPPAETEIVCFAAKEKWVCAPAGDRQQAHQKAMKLIDAQDDGEPDDEPPESVQITTVPEPTTWDVVEEPVNQKPVNQEPKAVSTAETQLSETETPPVEQPYAVKQAAPSSGHVSVNFREWQQHRPEAWVLQLVGTTNLPNLEQFINQHDLSQSTFAIATTEVKGAPWHIVLLGVFDTRDAALAHRNALSHELQSAWPRPIAGIELLD